LSTQCRKYCLEAIRLSEDLVRLARDAYAAGCDQDANLVFFGIIFDTGSKIRLEAEKRLKEIEVEESPK
jgi:hypothetical protein